jgi:hypothetical protein
MAAEALIVQWVVAVWLANGRPVQLAASEQLCREMARTLAEGAPIMAVVDGQNRAVLFQACWRAENGRLKEQITR